MNYLSATKLVVGAAASYTSGAVVKTIIANTCPTLTKADKAKITVGAMFIGSMVGSAAAQHAKNTVDDIVESVKSIRTKSAEEV